MSILSSAFDLSEAADNVSGDVTMAGKVPGIQSILDTKGLAVKYTDYPEVRPDPQKDIAFVEGEGFRSFNEANKYLVEETKHLTDFWIGNTPTARTFLNAYIVSKKWKDQPTVKSFLWRSFFFAFLDMLRLGLMALMVFFPLVIAASFILHPFQELLSPMRYLAIDYWYVWLILPIYYIITSYRKAKFYDNVKFTQADRDRLINSGKWHKRPLEEHLQYAGAYLRYFANPLMRLHLGVATFMVIFAIVHAILYYNMEIMNVLFAPFSWLFAWCVKHEADKSAKKKHDEFMQQKAKVTNYVELEYYLRDAWCLHNRAEYIMKKFSGNRQQQATKQVKNSLVLE